MDGIIDNLTSAINTWNSKLAEIWLLLTESPETFKGGDIWKIIVKVHEGLQAIGLALLVLFFVWGLIRTCTSWQDVKRPEQAFKLFLRFIIARGLVMYGMELMTKIFEIVQGIIQSITETVGLGVSNETVIPQEIVDAVSNTGFLESIPLWAVTLLGSIFITILSFVMILTVYGIRISENSSEGEIRNVWDLMEDYYSDTKDNSKVKNFLSNMSVFTRWYSYETGINDRFGDY